MRVQQVPLTVKTVTLTAIS